MLCIVLHIMCCFVYFAYKLCLCIYSEYDKLSGEGSRVCHRCYAKRKDFQSDVNVELKTVEKRRRATEKAASDNDIPEFFRNDSDELW